MADLFLQQNLLLAGEFGLFYECGSVTVEAQLRRERDRQGRVRERDREGKVRRGTERGGLGRGTKRRIVRGFSPALHPLVVSLEPLTDHSTPRLLL